MRLPPVLSPGLAPLLPALCLLGCASLSLHPASSDSATQHVYPCDLVSPAPVELIQAELQHAARLAAAGDERCVDAYYAACRLAWPGLRDQADQQSIQLREAYNTSLSKLLFAASHYDRLNPQGDLTICDGDQQRTIPTLRHGFAWSPADFQRFTPPPTRREPLLQRRYGWPGVGVPLVIERRRVADDPLEARFYPETSQFAVTAVLRFSSASATETTSAVDTAVSDLPILEFWNPLLYRTLPIQTETLPLAADLSAPLALRLEDSPRSYLAGFISPGTSATTARLTFFEPYRPGKVPLVAIHGLFSDPQSWVDLLNDLRTAPHFNQRYQIWMFRYPTGQGFLQSAAVLRAELAAAVSALDPGHNDPALRRIVLMGHSMGGLIAKLQITHSEDLVWERLANRPLDQIITTESTRALLAQLCYFDPSPHVARVIFIASPHGGALRASSLFGSGAALLVELPPEQQVMHNQLIGDNPGTFNPVVERRFPTSIDMLMQKSPLLEAMRHMRLAPGVPLHNIVGVSHPLSLDGPSDGVVSVQSAYHPGCDSERAIPAPHAQVHRSLETSTEILRILERHTNCAPSTTSPQLTTDH